jgi:hypothetical protein
VEVAGERLAEALLFEVQSGRRTCRQGKLLDDVREFAPVDVVVTGAGTNGVLTVTVRSASADKQADFTLGGRDGVSAAVYGASRFVAETLKLDAAALAGLREKRVPDAALEACYLSSRHRAPWVRNSGEERLDMLRPFLGDAAKHPVLAGYILDAGRVLSEDTRKPKNAGGVVQLVRLALLAALGTSEEERGIAFARANKHSPEALEKDLLAMVKGLTQDELDEAVAAIDREEGLVPVHDPVVGLLAGKKTPAQLAGALRCLGAMASTNALPLLKKAAENENPVLRAAAADALAGYPAAVLKRLGNDTDPRVAFAAAYGLWKQGGAPEKAAALARTLLAGGQAPVNAIEVLAAGASDADAKRLLEISRTGRPEDRGLAIRGLGKLGKVDAVTLLDWLHAVDESVLSAAVSCVKSDSGEAIQTRLVELANSPYSAAAELARSALGSMRPADAKDRIRFDLQTAPLYTRLRIIDRLAAGPDHLDVLASCVTNPSHHVRAYALDKLAQASPDRALALLPSVIRDPYVWPRVHAAALAAKLATQEQATALRDALVAEKNSVVTLYLKDALARAENRSAPAPRKSVNGFSTHAVAFGGCGYSTDVRNSPLEFYYHMDGVMTAAAREAHDKGGKIVIARSNTTIKNPLWAIFDPTSSDSWWLSIEKEFADIDELDGVVLGEESMYSKPWDLWQAGWRIFCGECGIEAATIEGDREKLTAPEKQAYLHWEQERVVECFNWMYDYIKLYFGKLRPGFMVSTFMPQQNGPSIADRQWKFDVGGAYVYGAGNLERYNLIRRYKTLWPDRRVMWLVSGNVGTPATYLMLPLTKYNSPCPKTPLQGRESKGYADSVTAWLAGADPAYFAIWLFTQKSEKGPDAGGVWVPLESISPTSPELGKGIENLFVGVEDMYRFEAENGKPEDNAAVTLDGKTREPELELEEKDLEKDPSHLRVKQEKQAVLIGFLLEQKFLYDIARVFSGLPRPANRHEVLFVGPTAIASCAIASDYDFISLINQVPGFDLTGYRLIGMEGLEKSALFDSTVRTLTAWLKEQPGVLYVRGWLPDDNAMEAATPADHDGKLEADWPWEDDVGYDGKAYRVKSRSAESLEGKSENAGVVLWKKDGFKGAVIFDAMPFESGRVRKCLADLKARHGVGLDFVQPPAVQYTQTDGITAASRAARAKAPLPLKGMELLTGEVDPVVNTNRSAAIVASEYRGKFVACLNGVTVLCDRPIKSLKPVPGGLRLEMDGLVQASAVTGKVVVEVEGAARPPAIEKPEAIMTWLVTSSAPGLASLPMSGTSNRVTWVRAAGPVVITASP